MISLGYFLDVIMGYERYEKHWACDIASSNGCGIHRKNQFGRFVDFVGKRAAIFPQRRNKKEEINEINGLTVSNIVPFCILSGCRPS